MPNKNLDKNMKGRLFNLKITEELRKAIKKDAYEQDKSASAIVREVLENYYGIKSNNDILR
jgi:predicted HicB family RNase H-like nuclease